MIMIMILGVETPATSNLISQSRPATRNTSQMVMPGSRVRCHSLTQTALTVFVITSTPIHLGYCPVPLTEL